MNRFKTCISGTFAAALTLNFSLLALVSDSAKAENPDLVPGMILVADAQGKVDAIDPKDKSTRSLKVNDAISEGLNVEVGDKSKTVLVFGNGSILTLEENTKMELNKFVKDPFSAPFAKPVDEIEPGVSETSLKLIEGSVLYTSMKLRTDEGSVHEIHTDAGTASVKGTTYELSYTTDSDGKMTITLSVTEGSVSFTDAQGNTQTVGKDQQVSFTGVVTRVNGVLTVTVTGTVKSRPLTPAESKKINDDAAYSKEVARVSTVNYQKESDTSGSGNGVGNENRVIVTPGKTTKTK